MTRLIRNIFIILSACLPLMMLVFFKGLSQYRHESVKARDLTFVLPSGAKGNEKVSRLRFLKDQNQKEPFNVHDESLSETNLVGTEGSSRKAVFIRRKEKLQDACKALYDGEQPLPRLARSAHNHIVVNDKSKILYCYIPKVACTNFKRIFLILDGIVNTSNPLEIPSQDVHLSLKNSLNFLSKYAPLEAKKRLGTYRKIIFVREPMERLLSAYINKFTENQTDFYEKYGRKIIKHYRASPNEESIQKGHDVKFEEFLRYITDKLVWGHNHEHWLQYESLCHPCHVQYDVIGKMESMDEDTDYLLHYLGASDNIKFPKRSEFLTTEKTKDKLLKYYQDIPKDLLERVLQEFRRDFILFDYKIPDSIDSLRNKSIST